MAGPLGLPAFRLLFAARAISYVGTYLAPIAVAFAILDNGGGATAVGLSFAAWTLATVAMLAFGGVLGDRLPRRVVMVGSDVASTAVRTAMGALLLSGHAHVWELIALQACGGAAVAFYSPASYGLVREIVPEELLQKANGLLAIARYAAFPLGAAVGGSIVALVGPGTALLVDAGTYGASALLLSQIDVESIARAGAGFFRELREGWSAFVEQTWVWVLVLYISFYFLVTYAPFFVLGPYVAKHSMHGASSWAFVVTGEGVGALLGVLAGLRWRPRQPMVTTGLLLMLTAVQNLILAFHPTTLLLTLAATGAGFSFALGSVVWDTTLQRAIPAEKLARVASYGWMGAMVFLPACYALAGPISAVIGLKADLLRARRTDRRLACHGSVGSAACRASPFPPRSTRFSPGRTRPSSRP
ncbi:MAG: MFS transporter [Actinobacteria bacterium]|nr:MAG: MFS transporter [Actinomycetota bacterium]